MELHINIWHSWLGCLLKWIPKEWDPVKRLSLRHQMEILPNKFLRTQNKMFRSISHQQLRSVKFCTTPHQLPKRNTKILTVIISWRTFLHKPSPVFAFNQIEMQTLTQPLLPVSCSAVKNDMKKKNNFPSINYWNYLAFVGKFWLRSFMTIKASTGGAVKMRAAVWKLKSTGETTVKWKHAIAVILILAFNFSAH